MTDTVYRGTLLAHVVQMETGVLHEGDEVEAAVDLDKRRLTMKNHTATHLLQAALQKTLGKPCEAGRFTWFLRNACGSILRIMLP